VILLKVSDILNDLRKHEELVLRDTMSLGDSIKLTLKILMTLQKFVKDEPIYIMFSGGKDSLVLLDLCIRVLPREQLKVVYIEVKDNTHEENVGYVYSTVRHYYEISRENFVHLCNTKLGFYEAVAKWGWPGPRRKWCMNVFKRLVLMKYFKSKHNDKPLVLVGTKILDSKRRLKRFSRNGIVTDKFWWNIAVSPIAHFTDQHVHEYITRYNLPMCKLYQELGESGNCVYCPFVMRREYYLQLYRLYPHWIYKIIATELKVRKGSPFIISPKRIGFKDILGEDLYNKILCEIEHNSSHVLCRRSS